MCKGIIELQEMSRAEGKAEGEECLSRLMHILADKGYQMAEIFSMTSDAGKRTKLYEEYNIQ
ncbi:MAG: hypothetical protein J6K15_00415 [Lachnospiraceae bacterium]|nr:hypothetical protein [Lachnospiraceae bacterium]